MVQTVNNIGKQSDAENLMIHLLQRFEARAALLKETAKKSSWPVTGLWNRGPLTILNGIRLREHSLMTSLIRLDRGVQDSPQKGLL